MTSPERARFLAVDDDPATLKLLDRALRLDGYEVVTAASGQEALKLSDTQFFDAALVDLRMPGMSGLELLSELKRRHPSIEIVVTTAFPEVSTAVAALQAGALDYVQKPFNLDELRLKMGRLLERRRLRGEVSTLRSRLGARIAVKELIGVSPEMTRIKEMATRIAETDSSVLIEGESGTGKEILAGVIHRFSTRRSGPFIPVNCGAIPLNLLESEFFGHVRGAFTGSVADALGLFRSADRGTIFLDEIGELSPELQSKLLRVLQEREVRPVGSAKTYPVDLRVIAASNRDLEEAVKKGGFRQDLFYRLNVVRIVMPALRQRRSDIPVLVSHFLREFNERFRRNVSDLTPGAMAMLMTYDFPGNVRELENLLERAYALGASRVITEDDLPALSVSAHALPQTDEIPTLAEVEREMIQRALRRYANNRDQAAKVLGLSRRTLYRRLAEYGMA